MAKLVVSGKDINHLVYKYLLENGYNHTAFCLENEAKVDPEEVLKRRIPPYSLSTMLERSLVLRYMELHPEEESEKICQANMTLLDDHICDVTEKTFLGKREQIKQSNFEIAKEIKEALVSIDNQIQNQPPPLLRLPQSGRNSENKQAPNLTKSKSAVSAKDRDKNNGESSKKSKITSEAPSKSNKYANDKNADKNDKSGSQAQDPFSSVAPINVAFNYNYEILETYFDGQVTNFLLKVKEGSSSCYMVARASGASLTPLFILPTDYISAANDTNPRPFLLLKHLTLVTSSGELCFINYSLRSLQAKLTLSFKPPLKVLHSFTNCVYVIVCERKIFVIDDVNFGLKREILGSYKHVSLNVDGKICLVADNNSSTPGGSLSSEVNGISNGQNNSNGINQESAAASGTAQNAGAGSVVKILDLEDKTYEMTLNIGEVGGLIIRGKLNPQNSPVLVSTWFAR